MEVQTENKQRIVHFESMREFGGFRYILGGAFFLFALYILWIGIYFLAGIILLTIPLILEYCSEIIIEKKSMKWQKKIGVYKPFLIVKTNAIDGVISVSVITYTSSYRATNQKTKSIKTRYQVYLELQNRKLKVNTFFEKSKANKYATEISKLLNIKFEKNKVESVE